MIHSAYLINNLLWLVVYLSLLAVGGAVVVVVVVVRENLALVP